MPLPLPQAVARSTWNESMLSGVTPKLAMRSDLMASRLSLWLIHAAAMPQSLSALRRRNLGPLHRSVRWKSQVLMALSQAARSLAARCGPQAASRKLRVELRQQPFTRADVYSARRTSGWWERQRCSVWTTSAHEAQGGDHAVAATSRA